MDSFVKAYQHIVTVILRKVEVTVLGDDAEQVLVNEVRENA
jgi:hypothetical protein